MSRTNTNAKGPSVNNSHTSLARMCPKPAFLRNHPCALRRIALSCTLIALAVHKVADPIINSGSEDHPALQFLQSAPILYLVAMVEAALTLTLWTRRWWGHSALCVSMLSVSFLAVALFREAAGTGSQPCGCLGNDEMSLSTRLALVFGMMLLAASVWLNEGRCTGTARSSRA